MRAALEAAQGRVLIDRFLENAIEIDVDAMSDGEDTYIGAVMQHVEEAGVHSGDSACVLPAPSLSAAQEKVISDTVRAIAKGLGVVGLLNVQLAIADGEVFVLEANPRASRTVPFASKATGLNLVQGACRLAAGEKLRDLALPPERAPEQVSVKAAVLPFHRFPGSDPVLGPEMRSTGEVMASAADLPTAFAKAERAAGRRIPMSGTVFLSVRDADKPALVPVAAALAGLGFSLIATRGTASTLSAGLEVETVRKVTAEGVGASVVDLVRRGRCDLVINTPQGSVRAPTATPSARPRSCTRCRASRPSRVPPRPCTPSRALARRSRSACRSASQVKLARLSVAAAEQVGPYTLLRVERGDVEPGIPGQFFMLTPPGRLLPRPMSLCTAPPRRARLPDRPDRPGHARVVRAARRRELAVLGPLGNGFDLDVAKPLLVGGGIGVAPFPYLSEQLGSPPAVLGFRSAWHAEAAALVPNAEVVSSRPTSPRRCGRGHDVLACGPEPMLEAVRRLVPDAQLAWEAPWRAATGRVTGASSRSTAP